MVQVGDCQAGRSEACWGSGVEESEGYTEPGAACVGAAVGGSGLGGAGSAGGAGAAVVAAAGGGAGSAAAASAAGSAAGAFAADASAWGGSSGTRPTTGPQPYLLLPPSDPTSEEASQDSCSGATL